MQKWALRVPGLAIELKAHGSETIQQKQQLVDQFLPHGHELTTGT
jgi:hypothetical protein